MQQLTSQEIWKMIFSKTLFLSHQNKKEKYLMIKVVIIQDSQII